MRVEPPPRPDDEIIDEDDWLRQGALEARRRRSSDGRDRVTPMRQVLGSSCLFTLVVVLIIVVVGDRFMAMPLQSLFCLTIFVWGAVFGLLLRIQPKDWRNDR